MDAKTALQQLKDIHYPQAISMWPVAPGWIALAVLLAALFVSLLYYFYVRYKQKKTIKFALITLKNLKLADADNINIAAEISQLIRRTALHYFPRQEIAGLAGNQWLEFLNHSGNTTAFTESTGRLLIDAPYRKEKTTDLTALFELTQHWLTSISKSKKRLTEK